MVWGRDGSGPFSYNGGDEQLQSCLRGAEALALSGAIDGLADRGVGFSLTVHDAHGRLLVARGRAVGGMAAVWLEEPQLPAMESGADYKAILRTRCPFRSGCATRAWQSSGAITPS